MQHVKKEILKLADGEYCIRDYNLDNYYFIVGDEKACFIDCGVGIGSPFVEVETLSRIKPFLLATHGHLDHIGNAHYFAEVYMHEADDEISKEHYGKRELISWYIDTRGPVRYPDGDLDALKAMVPEVLPEHFNYENVKEGDIFDLGNKRLETIATPGHTPGSVSYLSLDSGILYAGDALNEGIIIPSPDKEPGSTMKDIQVMKDSLESLMQYYDRITKICMGHDGPFKEKSIIVDYLDLCTGLLDGSITGEYEEQEIRAGYVVRKGLAEFWYEAYR